MRVESMVAQQAILSQAAGRRPRHAAPAEPSAAPAEARAMGEGLPSAVADRLASLFAADPGFAAAVSAHMPAARQASALDFAAYGPTGRPEGGRRLLDTVG